MDVKFPDVELIPLRNEVDRFGFSHVLSESFGLKYPPRSYCCYLHGWVWTPDLKPEDLGYYFTPRDTPIVVANEFQRETLMQNGFARVIAGGLPFAYVKKSDADRKIGSLLVMPPHSMKLYSLPEIEGGFFEYIDSIKDDFTEVAFCIHADDLGNNEFLVSLRQKGFGFVVGAHASDANSLKRMRMIFDRYEYVTTTIMGSHVLYAAFCGCRVSLLERFHCAYSQQSFSGYSWIANVPGYLERALDCFNNKQKLVAQFPWLFVAHPKLAALMTDWAKKEIGLNHLLEKQVLLDILGWTNQSRVRTLIRVAHRRLVGFLA